MYTFNQETAIRYKRDKVSVLHSQPPLWLLTSIWLFASFYVIIFSGETYFLVQSTKNEWFYAKNIMIQCNPISIVDFFLRVDVSPDLESWQEQQWIKKDSIVHLSDILRKHLLLHKGLIICECFGNWDELYSGFGWVDHGKVPEKMHCSIFSVVCFSFLIL